MNKIMRILVAVLALSVFACCFAACGEDVAETPGTNVDTTSLNLKTDGVLVMGTNAQFPPFEYIEGGEVVGLDAEMMYEVADRLGLTLEIKDMAFDSLPESLSIGEIDCIAAGLTVNPDREEVMSFTDGYYLASQTVIVKSDSGYAAIADLTDKKIGCQSGTTGQWCAEDYTQDVVPFDNGALAVEALLNGSVDAVIIDNNPANEYKAQQGDAITLLEGQFEDETYAVAVNKDNTALCEAINNAIVEMKADGTFDEIVAAYIK